MAEQPITISELTEQIKSTLENDFFSVYITAEISNYKLHSSGHHYFSLKDSKSQISAIIWRNTPVRFRLEDGMKVIVRGNLTVYPPQGKYQIECSSILPEGKGDLYLAFEQLKKDLQEKGYFDEENKKELPVLPLSVGISTSPTGAAIQDMISTIQRRFPLVQIYFRPTLVQGDGSAEDIVKAINALSKFNPDVIIIGRGGGSIEDLWSYNTEIVADAIFNSDIPIISAVGHETDFTIADFVADARAATPTAAAEYCTPITLNDFRSRLDATQESLSSKMKEKIESKSQFLDSTFSNNFYRRLFEKVHFLHQKIDDSQNQIEVSIGNKLNLINQKLNSYQFTMMNLHPLQPLEKGFALLKQKGKLVQSKDIPKAGTELEIVRKDNTIKTKVLSVSDNLFEIM
jgi:exodeoxyribonuclease VII large subunit